MLERALAAHPDFSVDLEELAAHLEGKPEGVHAEDLYLAFACARGDRAALSLFEQRHLARIGQWIARLREQPAFVDEVRQRLGERMLLGPSPKILDYSGKGPLGAWTRVAAIREALDLIEREKRPSESEDEADSLGAAIDPELLVIRERHLPQFRAAFRGALEALDATERNLLRFHLVDGLNIGSIGKIIGKSRATVGRMVVHCRQKVFEETRRRLIDLSGAPANDVRSLMRLLHSQLDVSIRGFLREAP